MKSSKIVWQSVPEELKKGNGYEAWRFRQLKEKEGENMESNQANPDNLSEQKGYYYQDSISKEVQSKVDRLMNKARKILTEKQWRIFESLAVQCNTINETCKIFGLSRTSVNQHFKAAQKKLQKEVKEMGL